MNRQCNVKSIVNTATVTPQDPPPSTTVTDTSIQQSAINVATQTTANVTNSTGSQKKKINKSKIMSYIGSCETTFKPDSIATLTHSGTEINQMQPNCQNTIGTASFTAINRTKNGIFIHRHVLTNVGADAAIFAEKRKPSISDQKSYLDVDKK